MKTRDGWVSNSSTTSFTCEVCGNTESGSDSCGIRDFGFIQCTEGHVVCETCLRKAGGIYLEFQQNDCCPLDEDDKDDEDGEGGTPPKYCPCCNLDALSTDDELRYRRYEDGTSKEQLRVMLKEKYGTYGNLPK